MTKQTYWLADESGTKVSVEGAATRDDLLARGWAETTEATGDEFVWVHHPDVQDPARVPAAALEAYEVRGWIVGHDPVPAEDVPPLPTDAALETKPVKTTAAGGSTKEN